MNKRVLIFPTERPGNPALPSLEEPVFFRCPACGEMVDPSERAGVLEHHRHVLHPVLYPFTKITPAANKGGTLLMRDFHA